MARVLISPIWDHQTLQYLIHNLCINKAIILVDKDDKDKQKKSLSAVKALIDTYKDLVDISVKKVELFDIPEITKECIAIIDSLGDQDDIFINTSTGRRPQSFGLIYASYIRNEKIKAIYYYNLDEKVLVELPKLSFYLNDSQKKLLRIIKAGYKDLNELVIKSGKSRPLLYKNLKELENRGFISNGDKFRLTEAGKIAMLD